MLYFAYGSNMSVRRLQQRVPSARVLHVATLRGHRLVFHKAGRDGSAKCDAELTARDSDAVRGVIYRMDLRHKVLLDKAEGLGRGYEQKTVALRLIDGTESKAITYYATHIEATLRPYAWYVEHVLRGAQEHYLPAEYLAAITAVPTVDDTDPRRHACELAIYRRPAPLTDVPE